MNSPVSLHRLLSMLCALLLAAIALDASVAIGATICSTGRMRRLSRR